MSDRMMDRLNETPVTYGILLVYVTLAYLTGSLGLHPDGEQLVKHGAAAGILVQDGEPWRLLANAFLHGNLVHLAVNSYAILILGPMLERYMRTWRFIVLYVVSALSGTVLALLVNEEHVHLVGGSGALFGMLGAALAYNVRGGRTVLDFLENHGARHLIGIIVINLAIGYFVPIISNSAHIGGLIGGFIVVLCFLDTGRRGSVHATGRMIQVGWAALLVTLTLYEIHPVLRFDYNLKHYLRETDPARKNRIGQYLETYDDFSLLTPYPEQLEQELLDRENEPRTGIPGVSWREFQYSEAKSPRSIRDAIKRWKRGD